MHSIKPKTHVESSVFRAESNKSIFKIIYKEQVDILIRDMGKFIMKVVEFTIMEDIHV